MRKIPDVSLVSTDFENRTRDTDEQLIEHVVFVLRLSKKRILPKSVRFNQYRVSRAPNRLTVHFHMDEIETARVSLIPGPNFSRIER